MMRQPDPDPREPISPHPADPKDRELASQGEHDVPDRQYPGDYEPCDGPPAPPEQRTGVKERDSETPPPSSD